MCEEMTAMAMKDEALEHSVGHLCAVLGRFLRKKERMLICFPDHHRGSMGWLLEQASRRCGAEPILWGPEKTWKQLLQQAFLTRADAIAAPPRVLLGLTKLKKYGGVPLFIRNAVTAGEPCPDWMCDGIATGLDCRTWSALGREAPGVTEDLSRSCAVPEGPGIQPDSAVAAELEALEQELQRWTSVLDCRLSRGEYGLELEMVVFPGEKLPTLPSAAKQTIRPWDPGRDEPFRRIPAIQY